MNIKSKVVQKANKAKQWYEENQRTVDVSAQIVVAASAMYFAHKYFKQKQETEEMIEQSFGAGLVSGIGTSIRALPMSIENKKELLQDSVNNSLEYFDKDSKTHIGAKTMLEIIDLSREDD